MAEDLPISGFDAADDERETGTCPVEVCLDEHDRAVTSGPSGYVFEVIGTGPSIAAAAHDATMKLEALHMRKMRYRVDIGSAGEAEDVAELTRRGLLVQRATAPRRDDNVSVRSLLGRRA